MFLVTFRKPAEKIKFSLQMVRLTDTLYEDLCTFMIICRLIFLRMRNFSDKLCREYQNTHFMFYNLFPPPENRAVYEIMW